MKMNMNLDSIEIDPEEFTPFIIDEAKKSIMDARRLKETLSKKEFEKGQDEKFALGIF